MRNILVYRDLLLPASEHAFMKRQYLGFRELAPYWIGCKLTGDMGASGITPHLIGGKGLGGSAARLLLKIVGIAPWDESVARLSPVLIHAQFGRGGALALPLAQRLKLPLVVTFHGGDAFKDKHYREQIVPSIFQRRWASLIVYASAFICVSEPVRDKLIERGVPEPKLSVIPIGSDGVLPATPARRPKHILFAGRFVAKKGIFVLIDAISRMRENGITTPIVLAGDGPDLAEARRRVEGLSSVEFPGWLDANQLRCAMMEAHAVVVPSITARGGDREGLPSVLVEALAVACPVVASDATGIQAISGFMHAGRMVPAGDATMLAEALSEIVRNPELANQCSSGALDLAQTQFSAPDQSRKLEQLLLKVIG
jgi:glycosyltransferase involved in cell wall biosynthesis